MQTLGPSFLVSKVAFTPVMANGYSYVISKSSKVFLTKAEVFSSKYPTSGFFKISSAIDNEISYSIVIEQFDSNLNEYTNTFNDLFTIKKVDDNFLFIKQNIEQLKDYTYRIGSKTDTTQTSSKMYIYINNNNNIVIL